MTGISSQRVDYDKIAHLYDEPGRDYSPDSNLMQFIKEHPEMDLANLKVLDMGCGTGKQLIADRKPFPTVSLTGLDLYAGMLAIAQKKCSSIEWVKGDSAHPPFDPESFDYITNQFSYHHVKEREKMLQSIWKILRPGGRFVMTNLDPWEMDDWIVYHYFPASRERDCLDFFPIQVLIEKMKNAGFETINVTRKFLAEEIHLTDFLDYAIVRYRTSQLMAISDDEFHKGIENITTDINNMGIKDSIRKSITCVVIVKGDKPLKK